MGSLIDTAQNFSTVELRLSIPEALLGAREVSEVQTSLGEMLMWLSLLVVSTEIKEGCEMFLLKTE